MVRCKRLTQFSLISLRPDCGTLSDVRIIVLKKYFVCVHAGCIPTEVGLLTAVREMYLTNNELTGALHIFAFSSVVLLDT